MTHEGSFDCELGPPPKPPIVEAPKLKLNILQAHLRDQCRVCMDYQKLNDATWKDHYPLPFIDQSLTVVQLLLRWVFREKITFAFPYGKYDFKHMPFGLCNAPVTFQRCMVAIFYDMVESFVE
uniref:Reverse transcriptase domain-containing protein n=1 Tax=Solanum lycopersicum TaxID=4081 RepID=A0A3Q7EAX3_SOLLC